MTAAKLKEDDDDLIDHLLHTTAHAYLLFFSNRGKVYRIKSHEIPVSSRTSRGTALVNLLQLEFEEHIQAIVDTRDYETNRFLFFATRFGRVKKTLFTAYDSSLKAGLIAIKLNDGDELVSVVPTNGTDDIFMTSRRGQALRFSEEDVRAMGRTAAGVVGMKFRESDELVSCGVFSGETEFLIVTSEGFGKRVDPEQFTRKRRAGLGVRGIGVNERKGHVIGAMFVAPDDEIMIISDGGVIIRTTVGAISVQGRDATGVTVMSLGEGEQVSALARLLTVDEEEIDDQTADSAGGDLAVESSGVSTEPGGGVSNGAVAAGQPEANGSGGGDAGMSASDDDAPDRGDSDDGDSDDGDSDAADGDADSE